MHTPVGITALDPMILSQTQHTPGVLASTAPGSRLDPSLTAAAAAMVLLPPAMQALLALQALVRSS
jgi:hypothetical protein